MRVVFSESDSRVSLKTPRQCNSAHPRVPQRVWIPVRVYGKGNDPRTALLKSVRARLKKKYKPSQVHCVLRVSEDMLVVVVVVTVVTEGVCRVLKMRLCVYVSVSV